MPFVSDAQRRYFFANAGFSAPMTDRRVSQHAVDREAAIRAHYSAGGFSTAAADRAVERARENGWGVDDHRESRTLSYDDKAGWSASEWTAYSYGLGAPGKQEREEDNWTAKQWAAFSAGARDE